MGREVSIFTLLSYFSHFSCIERWMNEYKRKKNKMEKNDRVREYCIPSSLRNPLFQPQLSEDIIRSLVCQLDVREVAQGLRPLSLRLQGPVILAHHSNPCISTDLLSARKAKTLITRSRTEQIGPETHTHTQNMIIISFSK